MAPPPILSSIDSRGVATVTLNRPEVHNAFDDELIGVFAETLKSIEENDAIRILRLEGAGTSFCAGGNLEWMRRTASYSRDENVADAERLAELLFVLANLRVPSIACIRGAVYGGGVGLTACCDIALAAENARFCLSEVKIGLIPAVISPYVTAAIGARQYRRYALTAEVFDALEAHRIGLVHEVVANDGLEHTTDNLISTLLDNAPGAMTSAKDLIRSVAGRSIDASLRRDTAERIADRRASDEGKEGVRAFLEKRAPRWRREA